MLAKLEETYLNVLRLAILLVAGLVLIAAAAALSIGIFNGARSLLTSPSDAEAAGLAQFIAERRLTTELTNSELTNSSGREIEPTPAREPAALTTSIEHAANVFTRYLNRRDRNATKKGDSVEMLNGLWLETPQGHQPAYERSLRTLADELSASTGRPLSQDRVLELVQWHYQSLMAEAGRLEQEKAAASSDAWTWIGRAAQAFLLFVAVAFCFLLIRVERHLRVVRTQAIDPPAGASGDHAGGAA